MSPPSWLATPPGSPKRTTGMPCRSTPTAVDAASPGGRRPRGAGHVPRRHGEAQGPSRSGRLRLALRGRAQRMPAPASGGSALSALEEAGDIPVPSAELGAEAERAEVQQLVRAAIDGLNPGDRDVIELSLISELDNDELADALGVSRTTRTRCCHGRQPARTPLGALIVARTGRAACAAWTRCWRLGRTAHRADAQADQPHSSSARSAGSASGGS